MTTSKRARAALRATAAAILTAATLAACRGDDVPDGAFAYTGRDSTGAEVVRGWIEINPSSVTFAGRWHLDAVGAPGAIGPQTGDGMLAGSVIDGGIAVQLNPRFADNNVSLAGSIEGDRFAGSWTYSTFIGPVNHGTFEAVRK